MVAAWVGIVETTTDEFIRDVEEAIQRNYKLLALLQARGNTTFGHSGVQANWKTKFKRALPRGYADLDVQTYPRRNRHKTAKLPWRAYSLAEAISKFDRLQNRGQPAIVNLMGEKVQSMADDMQTYFGEQIYVDGDAAGNEKGIHGIESMMIASGVSTTTPTALPNDTYAGINTALGYYGGTWDQSGGTSIWPNGKGSVEYDFFSPLLVDYTNTKWTAATKTWANTCGEALRYAIHKSRRNKSKKGAIDVCLLNDELFRLWIEFQAAKERLVVMEGQGGRGDTLTAMGFGETYMFEGVEVTWEYGTPANTGYGFNCDYMELMSMQDRLFVPNGPYENEVDKSIRFDIDFFGNLRFESPRYFFKLFNYS
jgi:hypothetical protein